jgi:general stress protein 26
LWNAPERMQWFGGGKDDPGIHSICVHPKNSQQVSGREGDCTMRCGSCTLGFSA